MVRDLKWTPDSDVDGPLCPAASVPPCSLCSPCHLRRSLFLRELSEGCAQDKTALFFLRCLTPMYSLIFGFVPLWFLVAPVSPAQGLDEFTTIHRGNSTIFNPMLPGFHPDPSCIFVKEWDSTFFCASSSFNAFPGIPIHASKDLQNWKLIGITFTKAGIS